MRVNPHEMCYGVQARIKYASLSGWMQISIANLTGVKWHCRQRVIDEFEARVPKLARDRLPMAADVYARCLGLRSEQGCPRIIGDKMLRNGPAASCFRNRTDLEGASRARRRAGLPQLLGPRVNDADACGASEVLQLGKSRSWQQPTSENAFLCVDDGLSGVHGPPRRGGRLLQPLRADDADGRAGTGADGRVLARPDGACSRYLRASLPMVSAQGAAPRSILSSTHAADLFHSVPPRAA